MFYVLFQTILIGLSVSVDAFAVSISSGLKLNNLKFFKLLIIPITFGFFQFVMPFIGYYIPSHFIVTGEIGKYIDYLAFIVLFLLGIKMIFIDKNKRTEAMEYINIPILITEGISTSIDALSVGLTLYKYDLITAFLNCIIIGFITFFICCLGIYIGKYYGAKYKNNATIIAGIIFIIISIKILIMNII